MHNHNCLTNYGSRFDNNFSVFLTLSSSCTNCGVSSVSPRYIGFVNIISTFSVKRACENCDKRCFLKRDENFLFENI